MCDKQNSRNNQDLGHLKSPSSYPKGASSRERGIRTPGPLTVNGFQDRRIRPLCHLSELLVVLKSDAKIGVFSVLAKSILIFFKDF